MDKQSPIDDKSIRCISPGSAGVSPAMDSKGSPNVSPWHSRGYLPHFDNQHRIQAITFRLADSLPQKRLQQLEHDICHMSEDVLDVERRKRIEQLLDTGLGACHLKNPLLAEMVQKALLHFHQERYLLHAWAVMPNHVHVLISPQSEHRVSDIVQSWKSYTAHQANRMLNRTGSFWQREYYDRWIRDPAHLSHAVEYVLKNPQKAGLMNWPWVGQIAHALGKLAVSQPLPARRRRSRGRAISL